MRVPAGARHADRAAARSGPQEALLIKSCLINTPPILFQDQRYVVLNKPAGLPVHAGPRGGESVEDCFPALSRRRDGPWLAHRLDADTAGCLVVALRKTALIQAQGCFAEGRANKIYWAVVVGQPEAESGLVEQKLARHSDPSGWRMRPDPAGQDARTEWRVLGRAPGHGPGLAWLELRLLTGRTHQARVHCAHLGCPILGDPIYGGAASGGGAHKAGLHLLARSVALPLDPPVAATAPPPAAMLAAFTACGFTKS